MNVQDIYLELIKRASFNNFDGEAVVKDLNEHRSWWKAVYMTRDDLIPLRDMSDNVFNVDTMYIIPETDMIGKMLDLCKSWMADKIHILSGKEAQSRLGVYGSDKKYVICIWWD